mgnify:CR=1 FL=1
MANLWYNYDEVQDFHPIVRQALENALVASGFDNIAEVVHHPSIPNSSITPDFGIRFKTTNRWAFVIEVKRTKRDVDSLRYQNQSRSYVTEFGPHWETGYHKYFCVTNVEKLVLFADRPGPITTCILKNNPFCDSNFVPNSHDATQSVQELTSVFEQIFPQIFSRATPDWDNNWEPIINEFFSNYNALKSTLNHSDDLNKELTLFELFRLLAYSYLKDYYTQISSGNAQHFRSFPNTSGNLSQYKNSLSNNFARIIQLDFKQIFENHPNQDQRIFPENFNATIQGYFVSLITCFNSYSNNAVADNHSPSYVFNLLTSKIYQREEMHKKGKVMSDDELALLLATLTIDSENSSVIDPCCGDGALLDAAYDRLNLLTLNTNNQKSHNDLLNQVEGIEIDPFLSQLAAFRLLSKNLSQVNNTTEANIDTGNMFSVLRQGNYDALVMNPPFLRNDNPDAPITTAQKGVMNSAISNSGVNNFVSAAKQPNLYFYFLNYSWHYLKPNGKAGIILMSKFLNNEDGKHIKQFMLDKIEAIISYPRKYFKDFVVTTVVVLLKKGDNSGNVSFVRVSDENTLLNPDNVLNVLSIGQNTTTASYKLKVIDRASLDASQNWRKYLLDESYERFENLTFLKNIEYHFDKVARGNAENSGGKKALYPEHNTSSNIYVFKFEPDKQNSYSFISTPGVISRISYGICNNFDQRNLILTTNDISLEQAIHFPSKIIETIQVDWENNWQGNQDLKTYHDAAINRFGFAKWRKIVNSSVNHTICPKIIIPRADRTKHSVYYNPHNHDLTLSTNFFHCTGIKNQNTSVSDEDQYKFTAAFLMSTFGQIQFELNANNQEGLRKLEGFHIKRFLIPDLAQITAQEITNVVNEFNALNNQNTSVSGDEGISQNPRRNLDKAIAALVFARDQLGFNNIDSMVDYFELFLADLVEDRRL